MTIVRRVVAFLQNAWSPLYAGGHWPRPSWLAALGRSRSGQRLHILVEAAGPGVAFYFDNTTPIVGATPGSVVAPSVIHVRDVLREQDPAIVVALGQQAAAVLRVVRPTVPVLVLPHPAYRVVTNALYSEAGLLLRDGMDADTYLRQGRGEILRGAAV